MSSSRNIWKKAKERDRIKARYIIRNRLTNLELKSKSDNEIERHDKDEVDVLERDNHDILLQFIKSIEGGNSSYFGIHKLSQSLDVLDEKFSKTEIDSTRVREISRSRYGESFSLNLWQYVFEKNKPLTLISYAAFLGENKILKCLLLSLANPTALNAEDCITSCQVISTFCSQTFPNSLYCGIVRRVCEMRLSKTSLEDKEANNNTCHLCSLSSSTNTPILRWNIEGKIDKFHCQHFFCEKCLWEDLLQNYLYRQDEIIQCPLCVKDENLHQKSNSLLNMKCISPFSSHESKQRKALSKSLFQSLPEKSSQLRDLKQGGHKKKKNAIHFSWKTAIEQQPNLIGQSQDVRRDKFFFYTLKNAFHFIQAILQQGVDIDCLNQYHQTNLYIACWLDYIELVRLFLYYGADPYIAAYGSSCFHIANYYQHFEITDLLLNHCKESQQQFSVPLLSSLDIRELASAPTLSILIETISDHAGRGSFIIDNIISENFITTIHNLFLSLLPCAQDENCPSQRYMYCDAEEYICDAFSNATKQVYGDKLKEVIFFPNLRFLEYTTPGASLPPHVDLFRTHDYLTDIRSTHTVIFYLTDCSHGGSTSLLSHISSYNNSASDNDNVKVLAKVKSKRGRLLLFPHLCPHQGDTVVDFPKIIMRGEAYLKFK